MKRDIFKFLCGAAAAGCYGHVIYAVWTARGTISTPIWKGREWGVGKMTLEALFYAALTAGFGYLGWRPERTKELP